MVDTETRRRAADLLDRYLEKVITNDELERKWPTSADGALEAIRLAIWFSYDDEKTHLGPLTEEDMVKRCADFLKTDEEYAWPTPPRWKVLLALPITILTLGWFPDPLWGAMRHPAWPFAPARHH